jgi:hydroxymethylbilane synthase
MDELVLGTRGSALALWQARHVVERLSQSDPDLTLRLRVIRTEGDLSSRSRFGAQDRGVFVRRIEEELLAGNIDLAVHSLKDLPTEQPDGLTIAAVLERHDPRDILLTLDGLEIRDLAPGCVLGTGSPRRKCQLLNLRPDLRIEPIRGNVDTRIAAVRNGRFGGVVLARAGVERLGLDSVPFRVIEPSICLPAVGQGALAVETRSADLPLLRSLAALDHAASRAAVTAERGFLSRLGGGCLAPATAFARIEEDRILLDAVIGDEEGREILRDRAEGSMGDAWKLGESVARRMAAAGGARILQASRDSEPAGG